MKKHLRSCHQAQQHNGQEQLSLSTQSRPITATLSTGATTAFITPFRGIVFSWSIATNISDYNSGAVGLSVDPTSGKVGCSNPSRDRPKS